MNTTTTIITPKQFPLAQDVGRSRCTRSYPYEPKTHKEIVPTDPQKTVFLKKIIFANKVNEHPIMLIQIKKLTAQGQKRTYLEFLAAVCTHLTRSRLYCSNQYDTKYAMHTPYFAKSIQREQPNATITRLLVHLQKLK